MSFQLFQQNKKLFGLVQLLMRRIDGRACGDSTQAILFMFAAGVTKTLL